MAKSNSYWKGRFEKLEDEQYQKSAAYYKDVQEQFRRASNSIQLDTELWYRRLADNNGVSYGNAKRFLKESELEEFQWTVEQYINAGEEHGVDRRWMKELENASARHHISYLEAMNMQVQQHAELLSTEFEGGMTDFLHKSYGDQYYRNAFEAAKGTGVGSNLARLDSRKVDVLIRKPWAQDGANFSDRIWSNKQKLVNNLHTELAQNIIRGASPQNAIAGLAKIMEVSRSQAGRLIMTESAAISSAAQKDCFKALGVEKYEILATLDSLTSKICQELDGKVFDMKDYEVGTTAPPFHPNCRSTTVPHFDDEFTEGEMRAARDEKTGKTTYVPASMNYSQWEKQFVKSESISKAPNSNGTKKYGVTDSITDCRADTPGRMVSLVDQYTAGEYVVVDEMAKDPFGYDPDEDVVVVNPKHSKYDNYDPAEIMIHETAHRIDHNEFGSPMDKDFSTALVDLSDRLLKNREYYQSMLVPGGKLEYNDLISDIIASVTHNDITGIASHSLEYIEQLGNKELEVFADTFTILFNGDDDSVKFLKEELPELYKAFMKVIGE